MILKNREEAGEKLANKLRGIDCTNAVVYALPRGGVVVGYKIAKYLNLPLSLVITRKIGHPSNPEYAICAVAEDGHKVCSKNEKMIINQKWLKEQFKIEQEEAVRRRLVYLNNKTIISPKGKVAIIVDDGIATGLTIELAIKEIQHEYPDKIIVAVPVVPWDVAHKIEGEVNKLISLKVDKNYAGSVGAYYEDFPQVEDSEVIEIMSKYI